MPPLPKPLVDPQELARRNNESAAAAPFRRRSRNRKLRKLLPDSSTPARPLRAVGFFYPDRNVGFHDHRP